MSPIENAVTKATQAIDRAIADIGSNSASWQNVLQHLVDEIPEQIDSTIRNELQTMVTRSVAVAGIEFRCDVDFLGHRAIVELERLKAWLTSNVQPPDTPPSMCQVAPDHIDLKAPPDSWSVVTFAGYDLDHRDANGNLVSLVMLDAAGGEVPIEENRIGRTTHYLVTVNLRSLGRQLLESGAVKLRMGWAGASEGFPEVVILGWEPTRMSVIVGPSSTSFTPPHTVGDRDFDTDDDNPMSVTVVASLRLTESSVAGLVSMRAREHDSDYTSVTGDSGFETIYTGPAGYRIVSIDPSSLARQQAQITEHGDIEFPRPAGEVARRFRVWGDRDGDEAGTYTRVQVDWAQFTVILEETTPSWLQ